MINIECFRWEFTAARTAEEKLRIQTCPDFIKALEWAADGRKTYDRVVCKGCHRVAVTVIPGASLVRVNGNCPKK